MTIGNDSVSRKQSFDTNNGYQTGNGETMQTPFSNGAFTTRDTRNQGVSYGDGASN